eukprot:CAMPEP_0172684122 /NCGR_PEP_ID=MMETSP1074-20121228/19326_1 /TAXON_ID=2916 /ORGANISM="Ceratium fusus, Strain PA161109" /LENGTH=166 /DNA_ID=CAMNT_0013503075 /DNA_START=273 /DNA_END=773 /DNA_ORIENTATION=-
MSLTSITRITSTTASTTSAASTPNTTSSSKAVLTGLFKHLIPAPPARCGYHAPSSVPLASCHHSVPVALALDQQDQAKFVQPLPQQLEVQPLAQVPSPLRCQLKFVMEAFHLCRESPPSLAVSTSLPNKIHRRSRRLLQPSQHQSGHIVHITRAHQLPLPPKVEVE